jgi:hypothetical protein
MLRPSFADGTEFAVGATTARERGQRPRSIILGATRPTAIDARQRPGRPANGRVVAEGAIVNDRHSWRDLPGTRIPVRLRKYHTTRRMRFPGYWGWPDHYGDSSR